MPHLYSYTCPEGHEHDAFVAMDARNEPRECPECGETAVRVWTAPRVANDGRYSYRWDK